MKNMEDALQKDSRADQWFPSHLEDKRSSALGALQFIRSRGSVRGQLRDSAANRAKRSDHPRTASGVDSSGGSTAGGFGKWLKGHLKGSKSNHENSQMPDGKSRGLDSATSGARGEKVLSRSAYTPQNVYCSLPREPRKFSESGKTGEDARDSSRQRSGSCHVRGERVVSPCELAGITRGGPFYGSEGKSQRRKNRERRRHSMNEFRGSHRRKSCIPDGGGSRSAMTELQPSPPGYRGQDEAPGSLICNSSFNKTYLSHSHPTDSANYVAFLQDGGNYQLGNKQQNASSRGSSPGEHYHRKADRRPSENENNVGDSIGKKPAAIAGYNEGYKKNTLGYKNDSGYSESIGFDSFSLPLNERDEASPPPTPPVRDASSLKGVCYGPGHEKYPSWPSAPERHSDDDSVGHSGSHRSKSWTDHTNYPKEKPAQYTRPLAKRPNPAFTQQLKTVMERCEKIPAETFESRGSRSSLEDDQPRLWPRVDREGKPLGDAEYVVPSPPEREEQQPSQTLNHADLEAYVRSYQDPQVPQVDIYRETTLTQAGLEEYTRVQHSQQASYAQSEGYHSYVSSVDSTTHTPFLDRLRRDSEAVAQRAAASWEEASREGRDSVVTTSSGGSASSSETLKWHGSMSDVSVSGRAVHPETWAHGSISDVSTVNHPKPSDPKWKDPGSDVTSSAGSQKHRDWREKKWQAAMNDRNSKQLSRPSLPAVISHCASVNDVCQAVLGREGKWQESSIDEETQERSKSIQRGWESCLNVDQARYNQSPRPVPGSSAQQHTPDEWNGLGGSMSDVSQGNISIHGSSKQLIAHSARVQTPQRHHSESVLYLDRERNQRKLYPVSTTQPQDMQGSRVSPTSPQAQLSVAERINELEKQQMRYTYLDPEKRMRVSDPTLKAIQKKALLSFYERHHQSSWRSEPQLMPGSAPAHSPPPQPPPRPRPPSSRRASSASDYANGNWREKSSRGHTDLPSPKHQHSNSCGSLSTDLLGPVIVGPSISIDDWVPERPPKKPHLRSAFTDRVPSPDLPPPSPPTVTENEVLACDEPLPPPPAPAELGEPPKEPEENLKRVKASQIERSSVRRSKHAKRPEKWSPSRPCGSSTLSPPPGDQNFIRGRALEQDLARETGKRTEYPAQRVMATARSSLRYPSTPKLVINGRIAPLRRSQDEPRPPARFPDLVSQRYSDSGNQRPAPQVPVTRQELQSARLDASGLLKTTDGCLEATSGQRPQPQVPKTNGNGRTSPYATRPSFLAVDKTSKWSDSGFYAVGSPVKTSYEANSKLLAEGSPQKYHEPPKYGTGHARNYYALPPKFFDASKGQVGSLERFSSSSSSSSPPPPLAPRQNTPGRKSLPAPPRPAPPHALQGSQSKASYLSYKRERGAPDSEGSYKRTMSPIARLDDWPPPQEREDPVLLRVTPHHHNPHELSKSHSVDALHHRIEERTNAHHSVEVIGKLSHELSKKLQATDTRARSESNNNSNIIINNNDCYEDRLRSGIIQRPLEKRLEHQERLSPQSVEVLNDRNRQLERERRKLAANCESGSDNKLDMDDFYRERSATIEMTSRNVELLNRRNALPEKSQSGSSSMSEIPSMENLNRSGTEKILHNSPSRFSKSENEDSLGRSQGAVSRRSGSCSSSSSSSTRSSLEHSRSSPTKIYSTGEAKSLSELENSKGAYNPSSPRSKVSSPSQTENSWTKFGSSQTESLFTNRLRRTSSSGSRSSSLSSNSKMSSSSSLSLSPRYSPIEGKDSPCVSPQPGIESLTLMQRTEVVLRVNATTMDVGSQTEIIEEDAKDSEKMLPELRKKLPEEIECEQLSRDLVNVLAPNDKLVPILVPAPEHKKPTDYVSGLFRVETQFQPRSKRPVSFDDTSSLPASMESGIDADRKSEMPSTPTVPTSPLSPTSAYFTTSESKARFLTRYSRDMTEADVPASGTDCPSDSIDLKQKKEELVLRLDRKVVVLRAEQEAVREDGEINDALGAKVSSRISAVARPAEASKYRLHVEEVGKITSLLLGLSGRLARAENALHGMPPDHEERKTLESKRDKLLEQLEEAKILKNNIDKRSISVAAILSKYLTNEEFADYQHFITMKTKLIMDGREIQDKVKLGEEQLAALKEAMG